MAGVLFVLVLYEVVMFLVRLRTRRRDQRLWADARVLRVLRVRARRRLVRRAGGR
ncbi:hypothetical protein [Sorangium sp. So ce1151]|uniref:hypothetical protein n=1 Tax=Sorangium sp. So ce1151 TaxID=3133332 RepID=UPI003F5E2747